MTNDQIVEIREYVDGIPDICLEADTTSFREVARLLLGDRTVYRNLLREWMAYAADHERRTAVGLDDQEIDLWGKTRATLGEG